MSAILKIISRVLLLALMALAPLTLGHLTEFETPVYLFVVALATFCWLASGETFRRTGAVEKLLLWGIVGAAVVMVFSVAIYESLVALSFMFAGILLFFTAQAAFTDEKWRKYAWWSLVSGAAVAALWGAREYTTAAFIDGNLSWRSFGTFYNPNCLAGYLAMFLVVPAALAMVAKTRQATAVKLPAVSKLDKNKSKVKSEKPEVLVDEAPRYAEIAGITLTCVLGLGILCTGSKGAMLAAFAGVLVFAFLGADSKARVGRLLRFGSIALIIFAILAALSFPPLRNRLMNAFSGQASSGSFRVYTWQGTMDMIKARPVTGFGPGTFARAFPKYTRAGFTRQAHQTPLQMLAENGVIVGGIQLLALLMVLGRIAMRTPHVPGNSRLLAAAGLGGAVGLWLHNMVDYTWYLAAVNIAWWGLVALATVEVVPEVAVPDAELKIARGMRRAGMVTTGILVIWAVMLISSCHELALGRSLARQGASSSASQHLKKVLPQNMYRWVELSKLAEVEVLKGSATAFDEAIKYREKAIQFAPTEPTNYLALGRIYALKNDTHNLLAAQEAYSMALEYHPNSTSALAAMARLQDERLKNPNTALEYWKKLAALYDTPVRTSQAIEYFVDESYAWAWMGLARHAMQQNDTQQAWLLTGRALRQTTNYLKAQKQNKIMLQMSGQYDEFEIEQVKQLAHEAIVLLKNDLSPVSQLRCGLAYLALEQYLDAEQILTKVAAAAGPVALRAQLGLLESSQLQKQKERIETLQQEALAKFWQESVAGKAKKQVVMGWDDEDQQELDAMLGQLPAKE